MRQHFTFNYHILRTLHTKIRRVKYSDFEHPTFQGATAPTWGDPGCRFACPGLSAPLAFQAALAKIIVAISMLVVERLC